MNVLRNYVAVNITKPTLNLALFEMSLFSNLQHQTLGFVTILILDLIMEVFILTT